MKKKEVEAALEKVRPLLQRDGGDVKLLGITKDGIVKIQLQGHCSGCPMAEITLKQTIEQSLKKSLPDIKHVIAV